MCIRDRFYIIDEAHQITPAGFNAFLKTLEEPPANITFVLATTDPDKLPDTCLLYTSDAADERSSVDLGGRRIIKKKKNLINHVTASYR